MQNAARNEMDMQMVKESGTRNEMNMQMVKESGIRNEMNMQMVKENGMEIPEGVRKMDLDQVLIIIVYYFKS